MSIVLTLISFWGNSRIKPAGKSKSKAYNSADVRNINPVVLIKGSAGSVQNINQMIKKCKYVLIFFNLFQSMNQ